MKSRTESGKMTVTMLAGEALQLALQLDSKRSSVVSIEGAHWRVLDMRRVSREWFEVDMEAIERAAESRA